MYFQNDTTKAVRATVSSDGLYFTPTRKKVSLPELATVKNTYASLTISEYKEQQILSYLDAGKTTKYLSFASSTDGFSWQPNTLVKTIHEQGVIVPNYQHERQYVMYFGAHEIKVAYSTDLQNWKVDPTPIIAPPQEDVNSIWLGIAGVHLTNEGILLSFYTKTVVAGHELFHLSNVLLDSNDPSSALDDPKAIWRQPIEWLGTSIQPLGVVYFQNRLFSYWVTGGEDIHAVAHTPAHKTFDRYSTKVANIVLRKHHANPILTPVEDHPWESFAVFNPAALHARGKTHIVYRAVGQNMMSVLGYAESDDGVHISRRFDEPMLVPRAPFEGLADGTIFDHDSPYISGIGWGGMEDPRLTHIEEDHKIYLTYVAFDGWSPPRVALSSIPDEDFFNHNWKKWTYPVLISKPGMVNKNATVLPKKVNGKYVFFHRVFPNILVDYLDSLDSLGHKGTYLQGHHIIPPRVNAWDSRKVGIGPTPVETPIGWLVIYHAVDDRQDNQYKMGAMILDKNDPTKVLYRTSSPILEPTEWYENQGFKSGVAYPCGATIVNNTLNVYYGGADTVVCVAQAPLDEFLGKIQKDTTIHLQPVMID
ncbi:MAG: hypothetical protein KGJ07_04230 [Patescibacteria group bacterium]|nr:hypothetical protein [Patescibacteria group bacterium]